VIIVGVCCWYFSSTADSRGILPLSRGFWWALRYNFGSLCVGSFLLAVIWMLRVVFEYFEKKVKNLMGDNAAARCITSGIRCCLDCFHRFIKFLNENAYIQVALTGENFCSSAMNAFSLALKHSGSFFVANGIGSLISFLGKFSIAVGNTLVAMLMLSEIKSVSEAIDSEVGPLIVIFFMSYVIASIFMSVYGTTSLTMLQCLYADVDICSQNEEEKFETKYRPAEMFEIVGMLRK
jgi:solute carrier family 44 (choline transporter-like protein), member 2/4/5